MSSLLRCECGSTDIEEDNARGDAVCTNCGSVLKDSLIVSEVQFEEVGRGAAVIGHFVSSETGGGASSYGYGKFQVGSGTESREVTIKRAKKEITHLCQQLQLTQHYIDTAVNFFKMALMRHLTRGRKSTHIYAACVYITCRTEGTSHLLIDISDVQQICSYELGRTYLKISNALCINIPSVDPCLYIMRFANKLQFGNKTHEVSMTALRIVQRMKKDSIHSGRRPTGLCGAALLIAARMHDYSRTIHDIVRIVKIHESTLRKRLVEFADTPSSALTLDEFMSIDLEAEQDPPAFKAARKKDRDRIKDLGEQELTELQRQIDVQLEKDLKKVKKATLRRITGVSLGENDIEALDAVRFIEDSNMETIQDLLEETVDDPQQVRKEPKKIQLEGLKPDIEAMCTPSQSELQEVALAAKEAEGEGGDLDLEGLDDEEINNYILTKDEAENKSQMWKQLNAEYLQDMKDKAEKLAKEREEGKPEKKKRKPRKKIVLGPSSSAGEAIEKMLQEKKISTKINYDILKSITEGYNMTNTEVEAEAETETVTDTKGISNVEEQSKPAVTLEDIKNMPPIIETGPIAQKKKRSKPVLSKRTATKVARIESVETVEAKSEDVKVKESDVEAEEEMDDVEDEFAVEPQSELTQLKDMLNNGEEEDYYGYEDADY